ncbi:MAG: hypothetical protein PHF25_04225 [Candidatus Margulisbacteria bacterium]|nr:hypothetical protein [Candidatus Margulisiibacteriota bacterium]
MENKIEPMDDYLNQPESFKDIAKICIKKKNKGPFDQVVASLYRYQKLIEYLKDEKKLPTEDNKLLLEMLTKGLRYKNFSEFKEENISSLAFGFLQEIPDIKSFYKHLFNKDKPIKTIFLELIRDKLQEHEEGLIFLKNIIDKQIEEKEKQEKIMKMQQSKSGGLTI